MGRMRFLVLIGSWDRLLGKPNLRRCERSAGFKVDSEIRKGAWHVGETCVARTEEGRGEG